MESASNSEEGGDKSGENKKDGLTVRDLSNLMKVGTPQTREENTGTKATADSREKRQREEKEKTEKAAKRKRKEQRKKEKAAKNREEEMGGTTDNTMGEVSQAQGRDRVKRISEKAEVILDAQYRKNDREMRQRGYLNNDGGAAEKDGKYVPSDMEDEDEEDESESDAAGTRPRSTKRAAAKKPVAERQIVVARRDDAKPDTRKDKKVIGPSSSHGHSFHNLHSTASINYITARFCHTRPLFVRSIMARCASLAVDDRKRFWFSMGR
jgi:hypothetical protein